jgi:hypothetical protein
MNAIDDYNRLKAERRQMKLNTAETLFSYRFDIGDNSDHFLTHITSRLKLPPVRKKNIYHSLAFPDLNEKPTSVCQLNHDCGGTGQIFLVPSKGLFIQRSCYNEIKLYCNIRANTELIERLRQDEAAILTSSNSDVIGLAYQYLTVYDRSSGQSIHFAENVQTHKSFLNKFFDYNFEFVLPWSVMPYIWLTADQSILPSNSYKSDNLDVEEVKNRNYRVFRKARRFDQARFMHDVIDQSPDNNIGLININELG